MSKEHVLKIVQRLQRDKQFREKVLGSKTEEEIREILQNLEENGIQAKEEDLLQAIDTDSIMDQLKKAEKYDLGIELQKGLGSVVQQIDEGYSQVMKMYIIAFYLGVTMVLVSVLTSLIWHENTAALILGGLGMADVITSLIFRPAQELQNSRGNLAQLQAAFFNWINDVYNWTRYLQLVENEATLNKPSPAFNKMREVSDMLVHNTERMMELVECYCEVHDMKKEQLQRKEKREQVIESRERAVLEIAKEQLEPPITR
jgi:hypothetical protein